MEELYCAILELDLHNNTAQMDDLLKAINKLSANIKYSKSEDSVSSKEETVNTASEIFLLIYWSMIRKRRIIEYILEQ